VPNVSWRGPRTDTTIHILNTSIANDNPKSTLKDNKKVVTQVLPAPPTQNNTMAPSNPTPQSQEQTPARTLQVNFRWRKNLILIAESEDSPPLYLAKYNHWTMKTVFKSGPSVAKLKPVLSDADSETSSINLDAESDDVIGDSKVRVFHIDFDARVRGRSIKMSPAKRMSANYNYPSLAYSSDPLKPALMTWKYNSLIRCFDHELRDANGELVARFDPRYHGLHNFASIKLYGDKAWDTQAVEEVIVTGLTLYLCMVYRSSSPVPLVGALVTRTGKEKKMAEERAREEHERNLEMQGGESAGKLDWELVKDGAEGKGVEGR
jgi:hypothetical protein